jgi:hypothetical protein
MISKPVRTPCEGSGVIVCVLLVSLTACTRDVRLTGKKLRSPEVRTVSHYGLTLDPQAEPERVAFAMLRAIHDDVRAAGAAAREEALDKQFDLCAANEIGKRNPTSAAKEEFLYGIVSKWAPAVAHYADLFPRDEDEARARLVRRDVKGGGDSRRVFEGVEVLLPVRDPGGAEHAGAVVAVWLVRDSGYWRVLQVGFHQGKRTLAAKPATNAADPVPTGG